MNWPDLTGVLGDIPWAVAGAVATRMYMPERKTRDIDVVVIAADAQRAGEALKASGWKLQGTLSIGGSTWTGPANEGMVLNKGVEPWWIDALEQAHGNRDGQGLPTLTLPYLVLMKFRSSRTIDVGDIARMLGGASEESLDATRRLFEKLEPNGLDDLESLIELGKWEVNGEKKIVAVLQKTSQPLLHKQTTTHNWAVT